MYPSGGPEAVFYPSPPDTARIQFLTRYGNSNDITGGQKKFTKFIAGEEKASTIIKPYGIDLQGGILYICDAGIAGLEIIDLEKKSFEYFSPGGRGKLKLARNCFVDKNGTLYVADPERGQVVIFNENREYVNEIGGGENFQPSDVVISGDTIFITDPKNNRITAYNKTSRELLFTFPKDAVVGDENWLYNPQNICLSHGNIYITDAGVNLIKVFAMKGDFINSIGSFGQQIGQFVRPKGIAVDREQNLYVVDAAFENVQIFNNKGQILMFFGGPYNGPGDLYLPANVTIDYDHLSYYEKYVDPDFSLKYLIFVTNQYGPDRVTVYGRIEPK